MTPLSATGGDSGTSVSNKHKLHNFSKMNINYPAFFSSQPDEVFVQTEIVGFLEKRGFRTCYHLRDFIPGTLIANNIEDATETSRRMIFIVSRFECSVCLGITVIFTHNLECQVCLTDVLSVCYAKNILSK